MTVEIPYTPEMFKRANRRYVLRVWREQFFLPTFLAIALLGWVLFGSPPLALRTVILVSTALVPVLFIGGYFARLKHSLSLFGKLGDGKVRFTFDDAGVTTESALGKSTLVWSLFTELWEFPEEYLLLYLNGQFVTLPKAHVGDAVVNRIRERLADSPAPA